jgi:nickel-dependent lactate racemase
MPQVTFRRFLRGGEAATEELRFPEGWEVTSLQGDGLLSPLPPDRLPGEGSIVLPPGKTVIVVNDAQRPTPTSWMLERLALDWDRSDLVLAVATGSHRPPTEEELEEILGPFHGRLRGRIHIHRASSDDLVSLGKTGRGTAVEVSPCLEGAENVICLGSVEPHYFAGWTGGRKSLAPGLCSLATMEGNHRLALEEGSAPGRLEGNPLHLDLVEAAEMIEGWLNGKNSCTLTGLNVIFRKGDVYGFRHGPLLTVVEELAGMAWEVYGRAVPTSFPLVICAVDHPLDHDLYQALKAFENWKETVADGGVMILAADCPAGLGPPTFTQFLNVRTSLEDLLRRVSRKYRLGDHKLAGLLSYLESGRRLLLASAGPLPAADLPIEVFEDAGAAQQAALTYLGASPSRALIVEDGAGLLPRRSS